jgi:hypothetical protein
MQHHHISFHYVQFPLREWGILACYIIFAIVDVDEAIYTCMELMIVTETVFLKLTVFIKLKKHVQLCTAVIHMLSGKAVSQAVRGHFLVQSALNALLLNTLVDETSELSSHIDGFDVESLKQVYRDLANRVTRPEDVDSCLSVIELQKKLDALKSELSEKSRTARLWIQYINYVDIIKAFIRAERTADWDLHLSSSSKMLNLFACTRHSNYTKSCRLYLQLMEELPTECEWLHQQFQQRGFHAIRRNNRFWSGLSSDLTIEQVMMRSIKGKGGLTHGRGMTESTRLTWIASRHKCAMIHPATVSLADLDRTPVSHIEFGNSRVKRDNCDLDKMKEWLESNNPFNVTDSRLRCLSFGVVAAEGDCITCDGAESVGLAVMRGMDNKVYDEVSIRKAARVKTLAQVAATVAVVGKVKIVDVTLLFSRLLVVVQRSSNVKMYFEYELTPVPASLFNGAFMRKPDKAQLKNELVSGLDTSFKLISNATCVVDGGFLLRKVKGCQIVVITRLFSSMSIMFSANMETRFGWCLTVTVLGQAQKTMNIFAEVATVPRTLLWTTPSQHTRTNSLFLQMNITKKVS